MLQETALSALNPFVSFLDNLSVYKNQLSNVLGYLIPEVCWGNLLPAVAWLSPSTPLIQELCAYCKKDKIKTTFHKSSGGVSNQLIGSNHRE